MLRLQPHIILEHMTVAKESQRHRIRGVEKEETDISEIRLETTTKISEYATKRGRKCDEGIINHEFPVNSKSWYPRLPWHGDLAIGSVTARWQRVALMPDGFTELRKQYYQFIVEPC